MKKRMNMDKRMEMNKEMNKEMNMKPKMRMSKTITACAVAAAMLCTTGIFASADTEKETLNLSEAGLEFTVPESLTESGYYYEYDTPLAVDEMAVSTVLFFDKSRDELEAAAGGFETQEEFGAYIESRRNDMFTIVSVNDEFGVDGAVQVLTDGAVQDLESAPFDMNEIGAADGWTFYELGAEGLLQRCEPEDEESAAVIDQIIEDIPEMISSARFFKPEERPCIKDGTQLSFKTVDFNGNEIDSEELFGQHDYTLVNIWLSGCGFCVEEMPDIEELSHEFEEMNCGVVGIMMDGDIEKSLEKGKGIVDDLGLTFPMLIPSDAVKEQITTNLFPTTIFVDSNGVVVGEQLLGKKIDECRERIRELTGAETETKSAAESLPMTQGRSLFRGKDLVEIAAEKTADAKKVDESAKGYNVLVQDENGDPVPDAVIQFCSDTACMMGTTDAEGIAAFEAEAGVYQIHVLKAPEGFADDSEEYESPATPGTVVITLQAA